ncbi:MAG TPA: NADH-quinone oxidoreductase subunit N [Acidobacteriota bacterium]|nr:NADH-quinone oxidoreductase subunit N [Acidobacteriota bacterium]
MSLADLLALSPLWIAAAAAIALLLLIAVKRHFGAAAGFSLAAAGLGLAAVFRSIRLAPRTVTPLLVLDGYALFFIGLFFAAGFVIFLLASSYFRPSARRREEFFLTGFAALLGAAVLAGSVHFASFFLGLEILSVSLYVLISFPLDRRESIEAGIKYLVLAASSAAFLLFGAALVYGETGGLDFATWAAGASAGAIDKPLFVLGVSLMIVGIGFKLAVVPFHMWTPDVYQGAPAPSSALVATISKGGLLAVLFRFFWTIDIRRFPSLVLVFALIAGASMIAGNLLALRQNRVKRMLGYSSISHLGFLLVAFLAGGAIGLEAAAFYLVAYVITMTAAFGAVAMLSPEEADADALDDYRGLFWRRPATAAVLTLALLSLAGMPLTAGFLGKLYVAAAAVGSSLWALAIILVATSVVGLYYYLRVLVVLYARPGSGPLVLRSQDPPRGSRLAGGIGLAILSLLLIGLGIFPSGMIRLIRTTVLTLTGAVHPPGI